MTGNRAYRRATAVLERGKRRKSKKLPFLTDEFKKRKEMIALKVKNRVDKAHKRKLERLAKIEAETGVKTKKNKVSPAEQRQVTRRAKRIKFANKIKSLIS